MLTGSRNRPWAVRALTVKFDALSRNPRRTLADEPGSAVVRLEYSQGDTCGLMSITRLKRGVNRRLRIRWELRSTSPWLKTGDNTAQVVVQQLGREVAIRGDIQRHSANSEPAVRRGLPRTPDRKAAGSIPAGRTTLDRTRTFWVGTMKEGRIECRPSTGVCPTRACVRVLWSSCVPSVIISRISARIASIPT